MCQGLTNRAQVELALRQLQTVAALLEQSVQTWQGHLDGGSSDNDLRMAAGLARSLGDALGRAAQAQSGEGLGTTGVTVTPITSAHSL